MTVVVIGLVLLAAGVAAWRWREKTPPAPLPDEAAVMEHCRKQAQILFEHP